MITDFKCYIYMRAERIVFGLISIMVLSVFLPHSPFAAEPYYPDLSLPWVPFYVKVVSAIGPAVLALTMIISCLRFLFKGYADEIDSLFSLVGLTVFMTGVIVFMNFNRAGLTPFFPIPI